MDDKKLFYTLFKITTPNIYSLREIFDKNCFKEYDIILNSFHMTLKYSDKFTAITIFLQNKFIKMHKKP